MITEISPWISADPSFRKTKPRSLCPFRALERRKRFATPAPPHRADTAAAHRLSVERVIAYMRDHLDEALALDVLARFAGTSKFHFVRIFEDVTGSSPHRFLTSLRLQRAKELLLNSDNSILDVCLEVGYSSHGTFSRTFAFFVGRSPTEFRARSRGPEQPASLR